MLEALQHFWSELHGHMLHLVLLLVVTTALVVYAALNWRQWTFWRGALELRQRKRRGNRETLLVMPDISGFSDFVLRSPSEANVAQEITLQLLDAIVRPARQLMELAKIEGDSALLFCDANRLQPTKLGDILLEMFHAFDDAKARLSCSAGCQCDTCDQVESLELKVLVHRGVTSSFEFRGVGDVFGPAVIELYRMSKVETPLRRFVMSSKAANSSLSWRHPTHHQRQEVQLAGVGTMTVDLVRVPTKVSEVDSNNSASSRRGPLDCKPERGRVMRRLAPRWLHQA